MTSTMSHARWMVGSLLLLVSTAGLACAKENDWAVAGAPYRVSLRAGEPPGVPEAGWEIRLPDFGTGRPDMRDMVLLGADGKEIGLDTIWRGPGRTLLVLAESMPDKTAAATLYFGGNTSRRMRSWSARRSLLLETRRMPSGADVSSYGGWLQAWKKSAVIDGAAFVPLIFHGENPMGESSNFLSRYTGMIRIGKAGTCKFYTLSDDVSHVMIDGRAVLKWQQNTPPPLDPAKVPVADVRVPEGMVRVEYCHATHDAPAAMVLGWEQDGKLGNVPAEAWVHPGSVTPGLFESHDGAPVPLGLLEADRYLGYGGEWYVRVKSSIGRLGDGWQAEWLWPDGHIDSGTETCRLWMNLDPLRVRLRLRKGLRVIEGLHVLVIPREMKAASVNQESQLVEFTGLLGNEDPTALPEPARRAGFVLASAFLPSTAAVRWAEAWIQVAKPSQGLWVAAMLMVLQEMGKRDPQAALASLSALSIPARAAMGRTADLLELDLRVFGLNDPVVVGLAARLRQSPDKMLAKMAIIRLGDYELLNGRVDEAVRCFSEAVSDPEAADRKAPVIDRAHSLAIEALIQNHHLDEARDKLDAWERQRPGAKIDGDQLLWRARVMFLSGQWARSLQDLETSLKLRPGSPEEIDVLFWKGRSLYELGRKDEARKIWNALVKDYPKHERAESAKQWAEKM